MRRLIAALTVFLVGTACAPAQSSYVVGAVYPTGGAQGEGGMEEWRGVQLAAEFVNAHGGVDGRPIRLRLEKTERREQAPGAIDRLADDGVELVVGSYGSTISQPAAKAAARRGLFYWETGAVGELGMQLAPSEPVFRYPASGIVLGREAVAFVRDHLKLGRTSGEALRYTVAYADDVYGRAVGGGAIAEIADSKLTLAAKLPYDVATTDYAKLAERIADARTDVLVVAAYLKDGVKMRREVVKRGVPLKANIGTSSSYCMTDFGKLLGDNAVGLFASDKPDGTVPDLKTLRPEAASALRWARKVYQARFKDEFAAPVLTGFAGALGLFAHVLPSVDGTGAEAIARAARAVDVPRGGLPDGGGLRFGTSGADAGANRRATHVIWEWVAPRKRAVVWPPELASHDIVAPR
jgi:branched-chain amino acid transport system substrate-binding protein